MLPTRTMRAQTMYFRWAADAALVLHLAFIVFAVFGAALATRWRWLPLVHLPAAAWAFGVEAMAWTCPLTSLENFLRIQAGQSGHAQSFVEHYLLPIIYPAGLTRGIQFELAAVVAIVNVALYARLIRARRRRRSV